MPSAPEPRASSPPWPWCRRRSPPYSAPPAVRALLFPLAYLLFAVPAGDALIPHLMRMDADFVVGDCRDRHPVYREADRLSISSGE